MAKRKYYLVVDTETLGYYKHKKEINQKVFDLGFAVTDKQGRIYETGSFLVKDFVDSCDIRHIFYKDKLALYMERMANGDMEVKYFWEIIDILKSMIAKYEIEDFCAYNLGFDKRVIQSTFEYLYTEPTDLFTMVEDFDIYHVAAQLILNTPSYKWLANKYEQKTEKGNISTGAESCFRYIKNDWDFVEEHTGLMDVLIECQILAKCFRQKKKFDKTINSQSWRIVNK